MCFVCHSVQACAHPHAQSQQGMFVTLKLQLVLQPPGTCRRLTGCEQDLETTCVYTHTHAYADLLSDSQRGSEVVGGNSCVIHSQVALLMCKTTCWTNLIAKHLTDEGRLISQEEFLCSVLLVTLRSMYSPKS